MSFRKSDITEELKEAKKKANKNDSVDKNKPLNHKDRIIKNE